ncbi:GntR family transcriptional regulator [Nocardiopsis sp. NPDC006938]|uniref:GntR family transcriptional regulator n=1 Tax=Nocardiopsis sp. NPDC006938 TaxID=3364337 RepID=UPI0036C451F5
MDTAGGLAPYERIVADLRARIGDGELPPGSRVPSTREITREWGVAMATATKALAALRREGLVEAVRGVGTVVSGTPEPESPAEAEAGPMTVAGPTPDHAPRTRRPDTRPRPEPALTREGIVRTAIALADAEGLDNLSMRRVATDLRVSTMALYRHVASKGELLEEMIDHLYTAHELPEPPPEDWREAMELALVGEWDIYRAHPWAPRLTAMAGGVISPGLVMNAEWMMRVFVARGRTPDQAMELLTVVSAYTAGMALQATLVAMEEHEEEDTDAESWWRSRGPRIRELAAGGGFPVLFGVSAPPDIDAIFTSGLERLLDGIAPLMDVPRAP